MKKITYVAAAEGSVTFSTNKFTVTVDEEGKQTIVYNSYTFVPGVPLVMEDDVDAIELLHNGVFKEVVA